MRPSLQLDILRASAGPCSAALTEAHEAFGPRAIQLQNGWLADVFLQAESFLLCWWLFVIFHETEFAAWHS